MIPKMIHYCWFGGKPLPKDVLDCIKTWKKYCPDYEIKRWDESNFDVNSHPFMKAAYEAKAWAFVSDYARLKVVYDNGGIYLDTDVELLKKPDFLLENQCYIGIQQPESLCNTGLGFGAQKSSPVVQKMMECYDSISFTDQKKSTFACPWLNDKVIRSFGKVSNEDITYLKEVTVYPPRFFDPLSTGNTKNLLYGIEIIVNEKSLVGNNISLVDSDDMKPIKKEYQDGDVNVKILSGIAPRIGTKYPPEEAGWYIYCNGRLVVAADKSSLTTWKDMENRSSGVVFHNKYAGFRGIVYFSSKHPEKLPWNTTKTGIDETSLIYLRAKEIMFEFFKIIGNMLDDIKKNTEEEDDGIEETIAKMKGTEMTIENINNVKESRIVNIKNISVNTVPNVTISYKKPKQEAEELKKMLDVKSYKEVGEKTFEYYRDAEC